MANKAAPAPVGHGGGGGSDKMPSSSPTQYFSLRWNNHSVNLVTRFTGLYNSEQLVDVTLAAEGKHLQAHKMLLSACSDYFQSLFSVNPCQHPIVILKDISFEDLQIVVQFMYNGIVNVSSEKLPDILKTAETLQIKGLAEKFTESQGPPSSAARRTLISSSSFASTRHLSVPSQHSVGSRQLSTESLPEYFHRTHSPRQASFESRQYSFESSTSKRPANSPPLSPTRMQFRKKFRRMSGCGSSSERGNSVEDERSPGGALPSRPSPPAIHLSPSRQSSSSTDGGGQPANNSSGGSTNTIGLTVAKKKRELFSARSSRSGGSNKSSDASVECPSSSSKLQDSGSSGERQASISLHTSVEDPNVTTINLQSSLAVPRLPPRTLSRAQSAGEASTNINTPTDLSMDVKSPASDIDARSNGSSSGNRGLKRNRFLKRQDCLERGCEGELDLTITTTTIRSSPNSPLMIGGISSPNLGSPPPAHDHPQEQLPLPPPLPVIATSLSIDSTTTEQILNESLGPGPPPPLPPPQGPPPPPPPLAHRLPSVRVIPDAADALSLEEASGGMNYGLLHPNFRSSLDYPQPLPLPRPQRPTPPHMHEYHNYPPVVPPTVTSTIYAASTSASSIGPPPIPVTSIISTSSGGNGSSGGLSTTEQFGHCPKEREGPALGCNYCWNTTDVNGRILRRKTKYHCPDCQANLCIVPCFQAYHEALDKDKNNVQK